jgi:hypothetical protein
METAVSDVLEMVNRECTQLETLPQSMHNIFRQQNP